MVEHTGRTSTASGNPSTLARDIAVLDEQGYALQKLEQRYPEANFIKWFWVGLALLFFVLLYPGLSGFAVPAQWAAFLSKLPGGKLMYGA